VTIDRGVIGMKTKKLLTTVVVFAVVLAATSTVIEACRERIKNTARLNIDGYFRDNSSI
jgi:hypothetical protein